jgi:hypothetical protein
MYEKGKRMKSYKRYSNRLSFLSMALLLPAMLAGCGGNGSGSVAPTVTSTVAINNASDVPTNSKVLATFSEAMNPASIKGATFTVTGPGTTEVPGLVSYLGNTATFTPTDATGLVLGTKFTATIVGGSDGVKDLAGNALAANYVWSFTTGTTVARGPAPVSLGMAGNYVILVKTGVSNVPTSAITGDIGVSPAAATFATGFALTADATNLFSRSSQVTGKVYASNYAVPTPGNLTTAVSDMGAAYTDAAGRSIPDFTELGAGDISGMTLAPGLYKWGTGVAINTDVTLNGGANDVWIFQVAQDVTEANGARIILAGGAQPQNIFWQVAGGTGVAIGTTAHFEGVILAQKGITLNTGATINGRLLAQSAVTLDSNIVSEPVL